MAHTRKKRIELDVTAHWEITRICKETGEVVGRHEFENSVQTSGLEHILDLMIGASADHLDNGGSIIQLSLSSGSDTISGSGCDSGFPDHGTEGDKDVLFQWTDDSTDSYTISSIDVESGGGVTISSSSCPFSDCSKPSSENWIYKYTLSISGNSTNFVDDGLDSILEIMTDDATGSSTTSGNHWDGATKLLSHDNSGNENATVASGSGYPSRSGTTVTWVFTSTAGNNDTYEWYWVDIVAEPWTDEPEEVHLSDEDEQLGTKGVNEEWEYTYEFSLS